MELLLYILFIFSACLSLAHDLLPVYYNGDNVRRLLCLLLGWLLRILCVDDIQGVGPMGVSSLPYFPGQMLY